MIRVSHVKRTEIGLKSALWRTHMPAQNGVTYGGHISIFCVQTNNQTQTCAAQETQPHWAIHETRPVKRSMWTLTSYPLRRRNRLRNRTSFSQVGGDQHNSCTVFFGAAGDGSRPPGAASGAAAPLLSARCLFCSLSHILQVCHRSLKPAPTIDQ